MTYAIDALDIFMVVQKPIYTPNGNYGNELALETVS